MSNKNVIYSLCCEFLPYTPARINVLFQLRWQRRERKHNKRPSIQNSMKNSIHM